jgi:hypothetical protein
MAKKILIAAIFFVCSAWHTHAQEINFSTYADYGLEITNNPNDLNFNEVGPIIADGSTYSIAVNNGNATVIEITGVKFLDIFVQVQGPAQLTKGTDGIGFTLKAAYSNRKGNISSPSSVPLKYITVPSNNSFTIRAPILERQSQPPGPPPAPPTKNTNAATIDKNKGIFETFYLYLYGDITVGSNKPAGTYNGNITVNVSYDSF